MIFTRTFHPVGQGAFYSERFTFDQNFDFLTIYDCGTDLENKKLGPKDQILSHLESRIDQDLGTANPATGKHDVQLLFLSHFDQDHICGVHTLNPRTVVIPLLTQDEITCYELLDFLQVTKINWNLLRNPKRFFGNRTKVIGIEPDEEDSNLPEQPDAIEINEEGIIRNVNASTTYLSEQSSNVDMTVPSGTPIRLRNLWQYIAFNPKISKLNEFKRALTAAGWNWDTLADDLKSNLSKDKVKELRDIYKNISPTGKLDLNTTSLLVYSGPTEVFRHIHIKGWRINPALCSNGDVFEESDLIRHLFYRHIACMYFGDWKIIRNKLLEYYNQIPSNGNQIGIVQIPHHGSGYNNGHYALKYLTNPSRIISVISVGNDNRHRHPSNKTISDIMRLGSHILLVTDDTSSAFITVWELY